MEKGNTQDLLLWLREKIHRFGKYYTSEELCQNICGEPLNFSYFMQYAKAKYGYIYGID
jgi:carboxypeptidase Taq